MNILINTIIPLKLIQLTLGLYQMMTDQQQQQTTHFKGKHKEEHNLEMLVLEDKALLIRILNLKTLECFQEIIDDKYIQNHKDISLIFETPADIIKYLSHHFRDIQITYSGQIRFEIKFSVIMKPRQFALKISKKQMDKFDLFNLKMEQMKESFEDSLAKKDQIIVDLKQKNSQLTQQLKVLSEWTKKTLKNSYFFTHAHPQNPHNPYFAIKFSGNSIIVNHIADSSYYNFIMNQEITPGTKKLYKTKILRLSGKDDLHLGFGSKAIFGVCNNGSNEIILYRCSGNVFEGGPARGTGVTSDKGDEIHCEVDLIDYKVMWTKNGALITTTNIPNQMKNKSLYFVLYCNAKYDQTEIMLD